MAEETTTTTTTTTEVPTSTTTTTVDAAAAEQVQTDKQGELVIDEGADANVLKEQSAEERIADAQAEGLANHAAEHANDEDTNHGDPTSRDKVEE